MVYLLLLLYCEALAGCPGVSKNKTLNSGINPIISVVFFSCFKKCLGDVLDSVTPHNRLPHRFEDVPSFGFSSDLDLAQNCSCSVKTVECGQIFLLACWQLRKKAQAQHKVKVTLNLSLLSCMLFAIFFYNYSRNFHPIGMKVGKH